MLRASFRLTFAVIANFALGADVAAEACVPPFTSYSQVRQSAKRSATHMRAYAVADHSVERPGSHADCTQLWVYVLHETTARILAPFKYWHYVKTPSVRKYDAAVKELKRLIDRAVEARLAEHRYGRLAPVGYPPSLLTCTRHVTVVDAGRHSALARPCRKRCASSRR